MQNAMTVLIPQLSMKVIQLVEARFNATQHMPASWWSQTTKWKESESKGKKWTTKKLIECGFPCYVSPGMLHSAVKWEVIFANVSHSLKLANTHKQMKKMFWVQSPQTNQREGN